MTIRSVRVNPDGIRDLESSREVADLLRDEAERVRGKVRAPSHLQTFTDSGVGQRGAFAQIRMYGRGAVAIEYGTSRTRALAPLRRAIGVR